MIMFQKGLLVLSMVIASTSVFAGEGKNGPDTSGLSIPGGEDRVYKLDELQKAANKCGIQMAKSVYRQITKGKEPVSIQIEPVPFGVGPGRGIQGCLSAAPTPPFSTQRYPQTQCECGIYVQMNEDGASYSVIQTWDVNYQFSLGNTRRLVETCSFVPNTEIRNFTLSYPGYQTTANQPLPIIKYEKVVQNLVSDEFGTPVSYDQGAKQVHIFSAKPTGIFRLFNTTVAPGMAAKETNVTIDTESYAQCLQSELQGKN